MYPFYEKSKQISKVKKLKQKMKKRKKKNNQYLQVRNKLKNAFIGTYTRQAFPAGFVNIPQKEGIKYVDILQFIMTDEKLNYFKGEIAQKRYT